jgi:hypothetical protein
MTTQNLPPNFNLRIAQYVKLRDKIREIEEKHKSELKPYRDTLEQLNGVMLNALLAIGSDSTSTEAGTVYRTMKKSASIADVSTFWKYVVENEAWDLIDKRANVTAVADFIEEHKNPPPGVNFNTRFEVGVRRK